MTGSLFLHNVSLFANLSAAELEPLAQRLISRRYREGEVIFEQGSPGNSMYIVKSGLVEIVITDNTGSVQPVAQFGPGQVFGEFALLDGLPRSAGAVVRERSELLILTRPEFFMYLEQHPTVAVNLLVLISRRLRFTAQRTEHEDDTAAPLNRLARILTDLGDRYGIREDGCVKLSIRLTQGEVAGIMGCTRLEAETAITTLTEQGLLDMRGLQITIHDLNKLRALAVG
jgi:CRP/FNR family transcriptional regulator/CRP/FNR family cyclic AMP-dependent transcriptional regulator